MIKLITDKTIKPGLPADTDIQIYDIQIYAADEYIYVAVWLCVAFVLLLKRCAMV